MDGEHDVFTAADGRDQLKEWLGTIGVPVLASTRDRGNPGVLVALPSGRVVSVYVTLPVHAMLEKHA